MRFRGLAEPAGVVLASLALACLLTYPLITRFDHAGRVDSNDGRWSIWVVSWVAHSLTTDPFNTYKANIFYPHDNALTYSEANLVEGAVGVPVWLLTKNPYATHNFVVLFGFVLSAIGAYYLVRYLTGNRYSAAVAAVLFAYCPYVFARSAHIQLQMIGGLPICLLMFHRLVDRPTMPRAVALGVALWLQGLACAYYGIFAGLLVGFGTLLIATTRRRWTDRQYWLAITVAAAVCVGLTAPFFLPFLKMQQETGFGRTLSDATQYSANWQSWFASSSWVHRQWLPLLQDTQSRNQFTGVVFPGIMALTLGVAGIWASVPSTALRPGQPAPVLKGDVATFYLISAVMAFWIALGPRAWLYTVLHDHAPLFSFLRGPERTGIVVTLCLVVFASVTLTRIIKSVHHPAAITAVLFALAIGELIQVPIFMRDAPPLSPAYDILSRLPKGPLAEFPYWATSQDFHGHAEYMLGSTAHWQPLINGYSDHIPQDFRDDAQLLRSFPSDVAFDALKKYHARYVVLHLNLFGKQTRDQLPALLDSYGPYLKPLSKDGDIWLFEILGYPR